MHELGAALPFLDTAGDQDRLAALGPTKRVGLFQRDSNLCCHGRWQVLGLVDHEDATAQAVHAHELLELCFQFLGGVWVVNGTVLAELHVLRAAHQLLQTQLILEFRLAAGAVGEFREVAALVVCQVVVSDQVRAGPAQAVPQGLAAVLFGCSGNGRFDLGGGVLDLRRGADFPRFDVDDVVAQLSVYLGQQVFVAEPFGFATQQHELAGLHLGDVAANGLELLLGGSQVGTDFALGRWRSSSHYTLGLAFCFLESGGDLRKLCGDLIRQLSDLGFGLSQGQLLVLGGDGVLTSGAGRLDLLLELADLL